jgi:hypothetical protein
VSWSHRICAQRTAGGTVHRSVTQRLRASRQDTQRHDSSVGDVAPSCRAHRVATDRWRRGTTSWSQTSTAAASSDPAARQVRTAVRSQHDPRWQGATARWTREKESERARATEEEREEEEARREIWGTGRMAGRTHSHHVLRVLQRHERVVVALLRRSADDVRHGLMTTRHDDDAESRREHRYATGVHRTLISS